MIDGTMRAFFAPAAATPDAAAKPSVKGGDAERTETQFASALAELMTPVVAPPKTRLAKTLAGTEASTDASDTTEASDTANAGDTTTDATNGVDTNAIAAEAMAVNAHPLAPSTPSKQSDTTSATVTGTVAPASTSIASTTGADAIADATDAESAFAVAANTVKQETTTDTSAAASVFAAAANTRAMAESASVESVNNDVDALNPTFRARLTRVMDRMRDEFGHDVDIVEGYRSQSRQNFLYEQGRSRPGNVVTWTKSSKHTNGMAVDVKIDGTYDNPVAYQRLAQIAAQEGLRTLGARDPGHLELPSTGGSAAWGANTVDPSAGAMSRAIGMALGQSGLAYSGMQSGMQHGAQDGSQHGMRYDARGTHKIGAAKVSADDVAAPAQVATVATVASVAEVAHVATVAAPGAPTHAVPPAPVHAPTDAAPMTGTMAADHVRRLLDARDAAAPSSLSHLNLALDNGTGGTDRIRVSLRGGAVDTHIALSDARAADRMSLRVGELQRALEYQGLDADLVRVSAGNALSSAALNASSSDTGTGWTPRHGHHAQQDQGGSSHDRPSTHRDSLRQDADDARQRPRRGSQEKSRT